MPQFRFLFSILLATLFCASSAQAQQKFDLRSRGTVGNRYLIVVANDDRKTEVYTDIKSQTRLQIRATAEMEIIEPRKDGAIRSKITYRQMAVSDTADGFTTRYDSQRDAKSKQPMAAVFNAMIGRSLILVTNAKGKILALEGVDEFVNLMISSLSSSLKLPTEAQNQIREIMKKSMSAEKMATAAGTVFFPENSVASGDSWQRKFIRSEDLYSVQVAQVSTLQEITDEILTIKIGETLTADPKTKIVHEAGNELSYEMSGNGTTTIRLDKNSSQIVSQTTEQRLSGKLVVKTPEATKANLKPARFPVYMKHTMQVWAKKLEPATN